MSDDQPDRHDASTLQEDGVSSETRHVLVPVGTHVVRVPSRVSAHLQSMRDEEIPALDGTRVWIGHSEAGLELHLGDVDRSTLED